jgi:excisionase family DNA binding protein
MRAAKKRKSESGEVKESETDREQSRVSAPIDSATATSQAPALKTSNFVEPAWRGIKYITPELFRRRTQAYFGHHPAKSTMNRWLHSGRIRAIRVGNRWLIPESTWKEFLECCKDGIQF